MQTIPMSGLQALLSIPQPLLQMSPANSGLAPLLSAMAAVEAWLHENRHVQGMPN